MVRGMRLESARLQPRGCTLELSKKLSNLSFEIGERKPMGDGLWSANSNFVARGERNRLELCGFHLVSGRSADSSPEIARDKTFLQLLNRANELF